MRSVAITPVFGLMLCVGATASAQGPFTGSEQLDLTSLNLPNGDRQDVPFFVNDAGQVIGYSTIRMDGQTNPLFVTWAAMPGTVATELSLRGPLYDINGMRYSFASAANASGVAAGSTTRANSNFLGADAWVYASGQVTPIGVTLADLGQTAETAYEIGNYSYKVASNNAVAGGAVVYRNDGAHFYAAWIARNGQTAVLVPPGEQFIDPSRNAPYSFATDMNADGVVVGEAVDFANDFSSRAFKFVDGQYIMLGLTGPGYDDPLTGQPASSQVLGISDNGIIAGFTIPQPGLGLSGAWVDSGTGAVTVGLTGPTYTDVNGNVVSTLFGISNQGVAHGITQRPLPDGVSVPWINSSAFAVIANQTVRIGLIDALHVGPDGEEWNYPSKQEADGSVLGLAARVDGLDVGTFTSAWIFDPARGDLGTVRLGLSGAAYEVRPGLSSSIPTSAQGGIAAGITVLNVPASAPEDAFGFWFDAFVTDISTSQTTVLRFSQDNQGRARTYPLLVTQRGGVVGYYTSFIDNVPVGDRPFYWSPRAGFVDLLPANVPLFDMGTLPTIAVSPDGTRVAIAGTLLTGDPTLLRVTLPDDSANVCDSIDFNNDGSTFDPQDIAAFLSVYSEGPCEPAGATCNDIDFNNDGSTFDPQDIAAFLSVYSEGPCL